MCKCDNYYANLCLLELKGDEVIVVCGVGTTIPCWTYPLLRFSVVHSLLVTQRPIFRVTILYELV